jgi:hypothetical protein
MLASTGKWVKAIGLCRQIGAAGGLLMTSETQQAHGLSPRRARTLPPGVRNVAKSRFKFQKRLRWPDFLPQYGTEEQCADALFG